MSTFPGNCNKNGLLQNEVHLILQQPIFTIYQSISFKKYSAIRQSLPSSGWKVIAS